MTKMIYEKSYQFYDLDGPGSGQKTLEIETHGRKGLLRAPD